MSTRLAASAYGMRPVPTVVLIRLSTASVVFLVAGLATARPDVVALAAPFTVALFLAVRRARSTRVTAELEISRAEAVEGNRLDGTVTDPVQRRPRRGPRRGPGRVRPRARARAGATRAHRPGW